MRQITLTAAQGEALGGLLVYSDSEYSFRFDVGSPEDLASRLGRLGRTSLSVGTLQVELDIATGAALFVWGLHPRTRWVEGSCSPERVTPGVVHVRSTRQLKAGVAIAVAQVGEWNTTYDRVTGWVHVAGEPSVCDDAQISIASGTVLGLHGGRLKSIWLHPAIEP